MIHSRASFIPSKGQRHGPGETARRKETETTSASRRPTKPCRWSGRSWRDIVRQYRLVEGLQQRLSTVLTDRRRPSDDLYSEELAQSQNELETEEDKLRTYIEELKNLGVELKSEEGLCDFRSMMDGREVYLCWRLGEPEVMYWHELDAGFAGRQRLTKRVRDLSP